MIKRPKQRNIQAEACERIWETLKEKEGQDSEGRINIVERRVIIESKETDVIDLFLPT